MWSMFWLFVSTCLCNTTTTDNKTSAKEDHLSYGLPGFIYCPQNILEVREALDAHISTSLAGLQVAQIDTMGNPAYRAIFKSNVYVANIRKVLGLLSFIPPQGETWVEPIFRCINTQEEALNVAPLHPELWGSCTAPAGGTWLIGQFIYICPPFFYFPESSPPNDQLCPDVQNNEFAQRPDGHYFRSERGKFLTLRMLLYYGMEQNSTVYPTFSALQNDILRRAPTTTYKDLQSYILFLQLVYNGCRNIPNINIPPWTYYPTLNATLAANFIGSSDSSDNKTSSLTLPLENPHPLNASGLSLQGPSDAVGTS